MSSNKPSLHHTPAFTYHMVPLTAAADQIRLIKLLPPGPSSGCPSISSEAPLKCGIFTASLRSPPEFQALSYTWGDVPKSDILQVHVEGSLSFHRLEITPSLTGALRHIRHPSEPMILWIDQVCIDQSNDAEKGSQVAAMGTIYSCASEVLIWLGPVEDVTGREAAEKEVTAKDKAERQKHENEASEKFVAKMEMVGKLAREYDIGRFFDKSRRSDDEFWAFMRRVTGRDEPTGDWFDNFIRRAKEMLFGTEPELVNREKEAIASQLVAWSKLAWFTRVWVLQEYALAKKSTFIRGHGRIESQLFSLAHTVIEIMVAGHRGSSVAADGMDAQEHLMDATRNSPQASLEKMERRCRSTRAGSADGYSLCDVIRDVYRSERPAMGAKNPRDRIYSLLGLAKDIETIGVSVDYSAGSDLIYTRVTRAILESDGGDLRLLELVQFPKRIPGDRSNSTARLPSWVPDFGHPQGSISMSIKEASVGIEWLYTPTGDERIAHILPKIIDDQVLSLKGILVDEIKLTGERWGGPYTFTTLPLDNCAQVQAFFDLSLGMPGQGQPRDINTPWRTMLGNVAYDSNKRPRRASLADLESLQTLLEAGRVLQAAMAEESLLPLHGETTPDYFHLRQRLAELCTHSAALAMSTCLDRMRNKRPFLSRKRGYVGMGPSVMRPGDVIVLFPGARTPYILRPRRLYAASERYFELVGETYCHGVMDGEAKDWDLDVFHLI